MEAEKKNNHNPRTVICVGDIHGHIHRLRELWRNLEAKVGSESFNTATVIFLGDYNDRGPNTKQVLEFLIALPHLYPEQRHVFLCGNHDFAFASFVGALPPLPQGFRYSSTWPEFEENEDREGWWSGPGQEEIHLQVRAGWLSTFIICSCLCSCMMTTLICFKDFTKMSDTQYRVSNSYNWVLVIEGEFCGEFLGHWQMGHRLRCKPGRTIGRTVWWDLCHF
jgi:hypothetical protein